jgi:hypothetical protein
MYAVYGKQIQDPTHHVQWSKLHYKPIEGPKIEENSGQQQYSKGEKMRRTCYILILRISKR